MATLSEIDCSARKRSAVFRADGSLQIGGGHVMRCLALANVLAERGWRCAFAVDSKTTDVVPHLVASGHEIFTLPMSDSPARLLASRWNDTCDLFVVDHYGWGREQEMACRPWARRVLVFDDLANRTHDCDLLIDPNPDNGEVYRGLVPADCRLFTGSSWAILNDAYAARRRTGSLATRSELDRILVSFGMMDRYGLTVVALEAIRRAELAVQVDVAIGSTSPALSDVTQRVASIPGAKLHVDCDHMWDLTAAADLVIGAGGTMSWERCCLGLPAVVVTTASNQSGTAAILEQHGAALVAGSRETVNPERLADVLRGLGENSGRLSTKSRAAFSLCDGHGAHRLVAFLEETRAHDGHQVALRPVTIADADKILEWQAHPETRRYFRDPRVPGPDEHRVWLADRLGRPGVVIHMIEHDGEAAGLVRLDAHDEPDTFEVSILVAPERRGRGIGLVTLSLLRVMLPKASFVAWVHPKNRISRQLFVNAGFRFDGSLWRQDADSGNIPSEEGAA